MPDLCTTPLCQSRPAPRRAADGLRVCTPEVDAFRDHLVEIPDLWAPFCEPEALMPARSADGGRAAPGIAQSAPLNLTVVAMHDVRTSWAEPGDLINPQRALAEIVVRALQDSTGTHSPISSYGVWNSCRILRQPRLTWWALAQDWAGLMCWTVKLVHDQLAAMTPGARGARSVGTHDCGGRLQPTLSGALCGRCGELVSGFALIELGSAS
jgi:hypothetical protein